MNASPSSPAQLGPNQNLSYERTLMVGRFRDDLKKETAKYITKRGHGFHDPRRGQAYKQRPLICSWLGKCHSAFVDLIGEDWLFLALLGVIMAFLSFIMDYAIEKIQLIHMWLFDAAKDVGVMMQYGAWVSYTLVLVLFSTGFVHSIAPQAIGSGIPEMKTILRGVVLKEYLTFRTLIAKMVGLTVSLGSGVPVGKEGPFVHVASIVATLLSKLVTSFKGIFENESRSSEMLAAACAVGVACTFGAPVGGILFSIEVTSVYFAVRNYWRGFFAAACSATVFRLLAVGFKKEVTVVAFYKTYFPSETPFYPEELIVFALIGVVCGFGGSLFVFTHRSIVLFIRKNAVMKKILSKNRFIYPAIVALIVSSLTFPLGYGKYMAGNLTFRGAIDHFFTNFSWNYSPDLNVEQMKVVDQWTTEHTNIFVTLTLYCITIFGLSAFSNTLPLPAGVFTPVFVIGASFGRLVGEAMAAWFPEGLRGGPVKIVPGGYAVVGAAAFAGSVTHTVSVSVIVFELTGQLAYILPVMLAVLISNAVCAKLQPSIYDSMIRIKHLPYLPDILPTSSAVHKVHVEDIMVRDVKYLSKESTYRHLQDLLMEKARLRAFPLVDKPESMILLGSIPRSHLEELLDEQVGERARQTEAIKRSGIDLNHLSGTPGDFSSENEERPLTGGRPRSDSRFTVTLVSETSGESEGLTPRSDNVDLSRSRKKKSTAATLPHSMSSPSSLTATNTLGTYVRSLAQKLRKISRVYRAEDPEYPSLDLSPAETRDWEALKLNEKIDFGNLQVDPAPFQLVERTSLYKVHSLFSLLGLNRAYVTALGRLVGVVALRELRGALENTQWFASAPTTKELDKKISRADWEVPTDDEEELAFESPQRVRGIDPLQLQAENSETEETRFQEGYTRRKRASSDTRFPEVHVEVHRSSDSETSETDDQGKSPL